MKIMFADWTIAMAASNARQYDDNVWALDLTGELPEGWSWAALIAQGENLDIIELTPNEAGASAALTAAQLSMDGYYTIQIRGTKGDQVRHTNLVQVFIPRSLSGDATWPTLPTEFSQAEARIAAASAHPPIPGEDGYWMIWDTAAGAYKQSDTPVPGGDGGTDISLGLTSATVGQIAKITEVDAEGKPTKWEPIDLPSGGEKWELIADITIPDDAEESNALTINKDLNGQPFELIKCRLCTKSPAYTGASTIPAYSFAMLNGIFGGNDSPLGYTSVWPVPSNKNVIGAVYEVDVSGRQQIEEVQKNSSGQWGPANNGKYGFNTDAWSRWISDRIIAKPITSIGGRQMLIYPGCIFKLYGVRA